METPKPLTKAEWDAHKAERPNDAYLNLVGGNLEPTPERIVATLDALFEYRERTRDMDCCCEHGSECYLADNIAKELGLE